MKRISEGRFEVFTTKADAIDKFQRLQGGCRGKIHGEKDIWFYCSRKGKITISNPPTRHIEHHNSTDLLAEIIEQDGKTYVTYYTAFSKTTNVMKIISIIVCAALAGTSVALSIANQENRLAFFLFPVLALGFFIAQLVAGVKEEKCSSEDSEIMVYELEKRVEAVNLWDK